jgi:Na+/H+ antiporter NhaD/arsenite permease-like protein
MIAIVIIFSIVYLGMIIGRIPWLKVDRSAIALVGAVALLSGHLISGEKALASVDFGTLALLFGLMLVSVQLEMSGFYTKVAGYMEDGKYSPSFLLGLVTLLAGGLSAFLTNDVVAVAMTPVILGICIRKKLNPVPFLLGIAFAANSGAIATFVGNPQNMLISQKLNLSFATFALYTAVPAILSLIAGWAVLVFFYRNSWQLDPGKINFAGNSNTVSSDVVFDRDESVKGVIITCIVIGLFIFTDYNRGMIAVTAGAFLLMNAHFQSQTMISKINWELLILFFGLFVVNSAMESTGLPSKMVEDLKSNGFNLQNPIVLFCVTAVVSDIVSNVPGVMLLLPYATDPVSGPLMAIASGLSSNLIIVGSMANIIVVDAAASMGLRISFREFAKSGIPVSLISLLLGALWIILLKVG